MKSEKEFLQGMWETVLKLEYEERQKELARALNRKIIKRQLTIYFFVAMIILLSYLVYTSSSLDTIFVYVFCFTALVIGYAAEALMAHANRRSY